MKAAGKELAAGEWHHVAVSVGEEVISLYVDGGLAVSSPRSPYLQAMKSGWKGIVLEAGFKGALDELRFWNAALGGEEDDFFPGMGGWWAAGVWMGISVMPSGRNLRKRQGAPLCALTRRLPLKGLNFPLSRIMKRSVTCW